MRIARQEDRDRETVDSQVKRAHSRRSGRSGLSRCSHQIKRTDQVALNAQVDRVDVRAPQTVRDPRMRDGLAVVARLIYDTPVTGMPAGQ